MGRIRYILPVARLLFFGAVLCFFTASCSTNGDAYEFVRNLKGGPGRIALLRVRDLEDDYVYPQGVTRQKFVWRETTGEWNVTFPQEGYSYAGFAMRTPLDVSAGRATRAIQFRLKPREIAAHITFAVVDGDRSNGRVLVDVPLADYQVGANRAWGTYAIPLDALPARGPIISAIGSEETKAEGEMDWSDVREFRLSTASQPMPVRSLTITGLEIGRR